MSELPQLPEPEIRSPDGIGFSYAQVRVIQAIARAQGRDEMREWKASRVRDEALSEEEIHKWWASENGLEDHDMCKLNEFREVVRAVEKKLCIGTPKSAEGEGA